MVPREAWHFLRQSLTPNLMSPKTVTNFLQQAEEIADQWCELLSLHRDDKGNIYNLEELAGKLGLEASCAFILGRKMGFILAGDDSDIAKRFSDAVHNHFIATRDIYFGLPFWKLFNTSSYRSLIESEETIYDLATELIANADEATKESEVFQSILAANIDEKEKTAAIIDFIAAGVHTSKNTLLFLLHLVAQNQEVQNKIIEDESKAYVKACVNEAFRYIPTAYSLARVTEQDLELSGYKIEAGSVMVCHTAIACRNERNFKNAGQFRPERWLDEEKTATITKSAYIVTPFGAGRRLCPGKRFIDHILPIFLEHVVKRFKMTALNPLETEFEFLITPKSPMVINFQDRY